MPKRYLIKDIKKDNLERIITVKIREDEFHRLQTFAWTYAGGNVSRYIRAAVRYYRPAKNHLEERSI